LKLIRRSPAPIIFSLLLLAGVARAQYAVQVFRADIPFEFTMGNKTFPAGRYSLLRPAPHFLILRDSQSRALATVVICPAVTAASTPSTSKLVFYVYGGRHFLAQVWQQNRATGYALAQPESGKLPAAERHTAEIAAFVRD
jgi:hypothetical protein